MEHQASATVQVIAYLNGPRPKRAGGPVAPLVFLGLTALILLSLVPDLLTAGPTVGGYLDLDRDLYMRATERWLSGGSFYQSYQLAGPYSISPGDILYPPVALWLFVPFTVLPAVLWWAVPLGVTAWGVCRLRPVFVVWPLLALCVAWPPTQVKIATGNPVIWAMAAMALGVVTVGPAIFALIKPSLFPFAMWGIRHRRWLAYLAAFVGLSLPFGAMWLDWLATVANSQGGGLLYSVQEIPMLLIPVIAWLGRSRRSASSA
jgi:hypothetical protein